MASMYYIAIVCPSEVDAFVHRHKQDLHQRYGCKAALKSPAHITLIPPFWMDGTREEGLREVLREFKHRVAAILLRLDGFSHFRHRTLFIRVEDNPALAELMTRIEEHLIERLPGLIQADTQPFHPHVTIATRDLRPEDLKSVLTILSRKGYSATFPVHSFSLLRLGDGKWDIIDSFGMGTGYPGGGAMIKDGFRPPYGPSKH